MKVAIGQVREEYAFSERRACGLLAMAVTTYRYRSLRSDEPLRTRLVELAGEAAVRVSAPYLAASQGRRGESRAPTSGVLRGRAEPSAEKAEALYARGKAAAGADFGEPGVGAGLCA
jgi:hypothetical protein